ncbi:hypothetical protein M427DRAFT_59521 [Gonapodya prolifera JEL478]|uniref:Uncharacterized protein n=1 Tax=Gonapodya prolifera (strain JEL478) TaxID=1344416 RepID=A0A139A864_GONPJ|nr:hypothetical protein M427DRAFT_59521 [Gonapodya prolifera JEL478]|eukprot:KXS12573.1 hypothetical protein M427DRAFT_59521 [Gonapodya prolifera JEL478]
MAVAAKGLSLRPSIDADDTIANLRNENLALKKRLNEKIDEAKKLSTKVHRLTDDIKKNRETDLGIPPVGGFLGVGPGPPSANGGLHQVAVRGPAGVARRDVEMKELVEDLKGQVRDLVKVNGQLQGKIFFSHPSYISPPPQIRILGGMLK